MLRDGIPGSSVRYLYKYIYIYIDNRVDEMRENAIKAIWQTLNALDLTFKDLGSYMIS